MKKTKDLGLFALIVLAAISSFYIFYLNLFYKPVAPKEYPHLRDRIGTLLWHSGGEGVIHTYCYYPAENISFENRSGEYIVKMVNNYSDCEGWHGIVELTENPLLSETDRMEWGVITTTTDATLEPDHIQ